MGLERTITESLTLKPGIRELSGAHRTRRDNGNDVNDPKRSFKAPHSPTTEVLGSARSWSGTFRLIRGTINQLLHLWKFDDDADRRTHWVAV